MKPEVAIRRNHMQHALLWLVALTLLVTGYYLTAIEFLGEEWFSRAGCLVVTLGIWSGLGGIVQERILLSRLQLRRRFKIARTRRKLRSLRADPETVDKEIAEIHNIFQGHALALSQELRLTVGILEVSLLITGTLIWGFGDLIRF